MPELPPVAAAVFVFSLLAVMITTTVVVQMRSRSRRMRLAAMVRDNAPIPRPSVSVVDVPASVTPSPIRGQHYQRAEREGRFEAFDERSATREGAPGRPGRRLAGQVAHAVATATPVLPGHPLDTESIPESPVAASPMAVLDVPDEAPDGVVAPERPAPVPTMLVPTHGGLSEVDLDLDLLRATPAATSVVEPPATTDLEPAETAPVVAEMPEAEPQPLTAVPEAVEVRVRPHEVPLEVVREPSEEPRRVPLREPQVTVLAPRTPVPALPAFMTRELTLGDAARVLRSSLTMTDGRQLRRAVAVGAATSMVAAAFAIRGRRR